MRYMGIRCEVDGAAQLGSDDTGQLDDCLPLNANKDAPMEVSGADTFVAITSRDRTTCDLTGTVRRIAGQCPSVSRIPLASVGDTSIAPRTAMPHPERSSIGEST